MRTIMLAAAATLGLAATPAAAASFSATVAAPTLPAKFVAGDLLWSCGPSACTAASPYGRPVVLCQSLARQAGPIESFKADGVALTADQLAKCNSRARPLAAEIAERR